MENLPQFKFGEIIKDRSHSQVYEAFLNDKKFAAYKIPADVLLREEDSKFFFSLSHENIVRTCGLFLSFHLLEFMECGSLDSYLHGNEQREYTVKDALSWAHQIAKGLEYIRSKDSSLVIRFLSPKRLMLSKNFKCLKINIFSVARSRKSSTYEYSAPEVLRNENITKQSDIYSFGIMLWEIMSRKRPYYHIQYTNEELKTYVLEEGLRPPLSDIKIINPDLVIDLIEFCWNSDPVKRPTRLKEGVLKFINIYEQIPEYVFQAEIGAVLNIKDIEKKENIGNGSFGFVYEAIWFNKIKAVKILHCDREYIENQINLKLIRELINIKHPNVISVLGVAINGDSKHLLMDFAECGSLDNYLHGEEQREYSVELGLNWMLQAVEGISKIYVKNQWSLKPRNMMLFKNFTHLKISDFYVTDDVNTKQMNKDIVYIAPEILDVSQIPEEELSSKKRVIYSFGIVFWEVMSRKKPVYLLESLHQAMAIKKIKKGKRPDIRHIRKSKYNIISSIIRSCWDTDPQMRPHWVDLISMISCPEMTDEDFALTSPRMPTINMSDIEQLEKSETLQVVGHGRFAVVKKGEWRDKEIALKKWQRTTEENQNDTITDFQDAFAWVGTYDHPNILKVYGSTFDNDNAYFLEDYAECGSLFNYLHGEEQRDYSLDLALDWMRQAADGMSFLHNMMDSNYIVNCSISPLNMMLSENFTRLKINDYCFSDNIAAFLKYTPNRAYTDPQGSSGENSGEKSAVYSFGIVLWEVMSRKKPFYHIEALSPDTQIDKEERPPLDDIGQSDYKQLGNLIKYCWNPNPEYRPEIVGLIYLLSNPKTLDEMFLSVVNVPPTLNFSDINLGKDIAEGGFGKVCTANYSGQQMAAKKISNLDEKTIPKEAKHLSRVNHENIVKIFGISFQNKSLYLLMEYAECGSLHNYLHDQPQRKYTAADAVNWMNQCAKGIKYMHGKKPKPIVHRDLKPANLLLFDNYRILKLGDFGTVSDLTSIMTTGLGTPAYIAPEVLKGGRYSEKCDIYSFGIILWEIVSRKRPFHKMDKDAIIFKTISEKRPNMEDIKIKDILYEMFIETCWSPIPNRRPKAEDICFDDFSLPAFEF